MAELSLNDATITFHDRGSGPVVLFLHGFPLSSAMWSEQVDALCDGFRCLTFDFRGLGASPVAGALSTMDLLAKDAVALLDALKVPQAAVVGCSMGGYIALAMHARAPERIAALVLSDTRAASDTAEGKLAREATAKAVELSGTRVLVEGMLPKLVAAGASAELKGRIEKLILATPDAGAAAVLRGLAQRADFSKRLGTIACPTLVLCGDEDVLIPPPESEKLAQGIPNAELKLIAGAGHVPNMEKPAEFNAALRSFLELAVLPA